MNPPKVTVVLPSYNHAKYLRACIDSVLNQSFTDLELFVWDDASSDDSWDIIQSYTDSRLHARRNETTRRMVYGMNRVISDLSGGEYIAIQHSDDAWEPEKLALQVDFLDSHPGYGAVFSNARIIDDDGRDFTDSSHFYFRIFDQPNRTRHEWLRYFFFTGNALCHPSVLIRREFFERYGLYRAGFSLLTDYDAWIRLCLHNEIHVFPEKLVRFRVRSGDANTSSPTAKTANVGAFDMLQALENFLQIPNWEEMLAIFPEAKKYHRPDYFDAPFVLGMLALEARTSSQSLLFGLNQLFHALVDTERAEKLQQLYGFNPAQFHQLKRETQIFFDQALASELQARTSELDEISGSAAWGLVQMLRRVRLWLIPSGSRRERIWYAVLRLFTRGQRESSSARREDL